MSASAMPVDTIPANTVSADSTIEDEDASSLDEISVLASEKTLDRALRPSYRTLVCDALRSASQGFTSRQIVSWIQQHYPTAVRGKDATMLKSIVQATLSMQANKRSPVIFKSPVTSSQDGCRYIWTMAERKTPCVNNNDADTIVVARAASTNKRGDEKAAGDGRLSATIGTQLRMLGAAGQNDSAHDHSVAELGPRSAASGPSARQASRSESALFDVPDDESDESMLSLASRAVTRLQTRSMRKAVNPVGTAENQDTSASAVVSADITASSASDRESGRLVEQRELIAVIAMKIKEKMELFSKIKELDSVQEKALMHIQSQYDKLEKMVRETETFRLQVVACHKQCEQHVSDCQAAFDMYVKNRDALDELDSRLSESRIFRAGMAPPTA